MTLQGHIHNGLIVLDSPIALPEGTAVQVQIVAVESVSSTSPAGTNEGKSFLERLGDVVGAAKDLPTDGATNLDHYLYGAPKRS